MVIVDRRSDFDGRADFPIPGNDPVSRVQYQHLAQQWSFNGIVCRLLDVVLVGSILLHLRDPFLALQKVSALVSDVLVVTDVMPGQRSFLSKLSNKLLFGKKHRQMEFLPNASTNKPLETWWNLSPELITEFLKVLGFTKINTSYHQQKGRKNKTKKMFTIIAKR